MVSVRRRPGVFLLAIATMMFSLVLLSATSSGAQTDAEDQNNSATAAVGDDECVEFGNEDSDLATDEATGTETSDDTSLDAASDDTTSDDTTSDDTTSDDTSLDATNDDTITSDDENANSTDDDTVVTDEDTDTSTTDQDAVTDNEDTGTDGAGTDDTNGEDFTASQDEGTENEDGTTSAQDDDTGSEDGTTSSQDEGTEDEECVVANTVPDESLLPTGAPASSSRIDEKKAKKKADRDQGQEPRKGTTQEKTTSGEAQKKSNTTGQQQKTTGSDAQKKTSSGTQKKTSGGTQKKTTSGEAKSKSNRSETQNKSASGGTQGKSNRSEAQRKTNRSETQSKSGSGRTVSVRGSELKVDDRAGKAVGQEEPRTRAESEAASDPAPRLAATQWTRPSSEELASISRPRSFAPDPNSDMTLSARALGIYDMPVSSGGRKNLDNGLVRVPETSRPWDEGDQKNVFIAGHYLGLPQTASRLAFYNLHELKSGDELTLEDGRGQSYKYRVNEKFAVGPEDSWAMGEVRGRDMVTLQTCIPPDFGKRLIVRADRVRA